VIPQAPGDYPRQDEHGEADGDDPA
jgi:hypothetical protein